MQLLAVIFIILLGFIFEIFITMAFMPLLISFLINPILEYYNFQIIQFGFIEYLKLAIGFVILKTLMKTNIKYEFKNE